VTFPMPWDSASGTSPTKRGPGRWHPARPRAHARFADPLRPFEHVSADTCAELVERHGWALPRRYRLHRAVVLLHMAPTLPPAEEAEVLLLEAGVACDVTGARSQEVSGQALSGSCSVASPAKRRLGALLSSRKGPRCLIGIRVPGLHVHPAGPGVALRALLRCPDPGRAEAVVSSEHQIITASSWIATATRRFAGSPTASS
jgi:hypothetical protein